MIKHTKRAFIFFVGILLLFLGIIGLALPFLQGILFIVVGLLLLSTFSPSLRTWLERHTRRFPTLHEGVVKMQRFITRVVGEA